MSFDRNLNKLKFILEHTRIVAHSRSSTRQSVFLTSEQSSKNQWQIESFDPLLRPEYEDRPVPHGTSLIIKHTLTGQVSTFHYFLFFTGRFPMRQLGAFRSLKIDCTNLRHRIMSWVVSKSRTSILISQIEAG